MRMRGAETGFTLIEVLIVVTIIGTLLSVAILSIANVDDTRAVRTEGLRFASLVAVSHDEAVMQGREFGVEVMTSGYRFVEYEPFSGLWADIVGDEILRSRELPEDIEFELYLEDKRVLLDDDAAPLEDPDNSSHSASRKPYAPHLMVFSSGEATPFELHVRRRSDNAKTIVHGDANGLIELAKDDEE